MLSGQVDDGHWDTGLLDEDELRRYEKLSRPFFAPGDALLFSLAVLAPIAASVGASLLTSHFRRLPGDYDMLFGLLSLAIVVLGWIPGVISWKSASAKAKTTRDKRLTAFRKEIGYFSRVSSRSYGGDDDGPSLREMRHLWYGSNNRDMDWSDRVAGQSYGMSADEYRNNVMERD